MRLELQGIRKSFGKKEVLRGISLSLTEGRLYGIVGENGSGKSTLLKIIVGEWKANDGSIRRNGKIGYCPQKLMLFPHLTVREHFQFFSAAYQMSKTELLHNSGALLQRFNFENYADEQVSRLSGGTQQKLNLSIALLHRPDLLILDEPYNGFDWDTYQKFWEYSDELKEEKCTILVVTHLLTEKFRFDKIYSLKNGQIE